MYLFQDFGNDSHRAGSPVDLKLGTRSLRLPLIFIVCLILVNSFSLHNSYLRNAYSYSSYSYSSVTSNTCEGVGIYTKFDCENFHRRQLLKYRNYTQIQLSTDAVPITKDTTALPVHVAIKFDDFNGADSVAGSVNLGVEISLFWRNKYIGWDVTTDCSGLNTSAPSKCPPYDVYSISWTPDVMWVPDFQLVNDQVPFDQGFPSNLKAVTDYTGGCNYVLNGQITYSCNFNMALFPFDTQECSAIFASRSYFDDSVMFYLDPSAKNYKTEPTDDSFPVAQSSGLLWMDSFTDPGDFLFSLSYTSLKVNRMAGEEHLRFHRIRSLGKNCS